MKSFIAATFVVVALAATIEKNAQSKCIDEKTYERKQCDFKSVAAIKKIEGTNETDSRKRAGSLAAARQGEKCQASASAKYVSCMEIANGASTTVLAGAVMVAAATFLF